MLVGRPVTIPGTASAGLASRFSSASRRLLPGRSDEVLVIENVAVWTDIRAAVRMARGEYYHR